MDEKKLIIECVAPERISFLERLGLNKRLLAAITELEIQRAIFIPKLFLSRVVPYSHTQYITEPTIASS